MSLFKRDATALLAKQRALLLADEAKIAELLRGRAAALVETEGVAEIEDIDQRIAALRRACAIHRDRIAALQSQVAAEAVERREARRSDAIRLISASDYPLVKKLRQELEASIKRTGDLFFQLIQSESVAPLWPFGPLPGALVDVDACRRQVSYAAFSAGRPVGGRTVFPGPSNIGLGVSGRATRLALLPR